MSYTVHPDAIFDPDKPVLGSTHLEARDNLIAVAKGETGAPKIANKITGGAGDTTFSGLGDFDGVLIWGTLRGTGGGTAFNGLNFDASTDGSTYGTPSKLVEVANTAATNFTVFIDFPTGAWQAAYDRVDGTAFAGIYATGTLDNTVGLTHLRIKIDAASSTVASYIVMPQGGQSAT